MNKKIFRLISAALAAVTLISAAAIPSMAAAPDLTVKVDGKVIGFTDQEPAKVTILGEAELTLIKKPSKTTYYIGDSLDTSGLKLGYTDTAGNYTELTKGFTISGGDTSSSGTQTVKVKYNDLSVKFDITVKTPSSRIGLHPRKQ